MPKEIVKFKLDRIKPDSGDRIRAARLQDQLRKEGLKLRSIEIKSLQPLKDLNSPIINPINYPLPKK